MDQDLLLVCYFVGAGCGIFLVLAPLVLLSRINTTLKVISKQLDDMAYLLKKHDSRENQKHNPLPPE